MSEIQPKAEAPKPCCFCGEPNPCMLRHTKTGAELCASCIGKNLGYLMEKATAGFDMIVAARTCAYCSENVGEKTGVIAHAKVCAKHPSRALEAEIARLRAGGAT